MNSKVVVDNPAEMLAEMAKLQNGCACATVKDGHVLILSVAMMQSLIESAATQGRDQVVVFVKRSDMDKPINGLSSNKLS